MRFLSDPIVLLIIAVAIGNAVVYGFTFRQAIRLGEGLRVTTRMANPDGAPAPPKTQEEELAYEDKLVKRRDLMNALYSVFANVTAIFPLLGMFGTVLALIGLSGSMGEGDVPVEQFFSALDTTAAGLVCAMLFKFLDAFLSVRVAADNKEIDLLLDRNSRRRRRREVGFTSNADTPSPSDSILSQVRAGDDKP